MIALNNYINGREVRSTARTTTTIVDPVTGNAYATAPKSNAADLDAAFRAATDAFKTWKETTPAERQLLLLKIADALMEHQDELAEGSGASATAHSHHQGMPLAKMILSQFRWLEHVVDGAGARSTRAPTAARTHSTRKPCTNGFNA